MHQRTESLEELIRWLKGQFDTGKYTEIHYGIWFELDKTVIPPEYIPIDTVEKDIDAIQNGLK